jgi:hypothetical protein
VVVTGALLAPGRGRGTSDGWFAPSIGLDLCVRVVLGGGWLAPSRFFTGRLVLPCTVLVATLCRALELLCYASPSAP